MDLRQRDGIMTVSLTNYSVTHWGIYASHPYASGICRISGPSLAKQHTSYGYHLGTYFDFSFSRDLQTRRGVIT